MRSVANASEAYKLLPQERQFALGASRRPTFTCPLRDREANLDAAKVHEVVLVGGCARIPRLQAAFKDSFGKPPTIPHEKDSAARGAAVQVSLTPCHPLVTLWDPEGDLHHKPGPR